VTRPKSPNFTKTNTKPLEREYLNERDPSSAMQDKLQTALMKRVSMTGGSFKGATGDSEDKAAQNPASTKSMTHLMTRRRDELEEKRKAEADKVREDKDRFDKQNRVSLIAPNVIYR
jgi:hypothetical protein